MKDQFVFRNICPDEWRTAAALEQVCFPPNEACTPERMHSRVMHAPELFLVAIEKESGKMAGFLNGVASDEERFRDEFFTDISLHDSNGRNVMLLGLAVLPEFRGRGLARCIVSEYCKRQSHRERLILTCLDEKVRMYGKLGFTDRGCANSEWGGEIWHEMDCVLDGKPQL